MLALDWTPHGTSSAATAAESALKRPAWKQVAAGELGLKEQKPGPDGRGSRQRPHSLLLGPWVSLPSVRGLRATSGSRPCTPRTPRHPISSLPPSRPVQPGTRRCWH